MEGLLSTGPTPSSFIGNPWFMSAFDRSLSSMLVTFTLPSVGVAPAYPSTLWHPNFSGKINIALVSVFWLGHNYDLLLFKSPVDVMYCEGLGEEDKGENNTQGFPKMKVIGWQLFSKHYLNVVTVTAKNAPNCLTRPRTI